jgi:hypothetical protein
MTNPITIIALTLAALAFMCSGVDGQPVPMPPAIMVAPLDMSAVQWLQILPQLPPTIPAELSGISGQLATTVWLTWRNPAIQIPAHTEVCGSFDLHQWQVLDVLPYQTNGSVQITNSNPWCFYRVANIL